MPAKPVDPAQLDLPQLALFVGMAANDRVLARMTERGFVGLRTSHGFVVQHLLRAPQTVGRLAALLGVTQQAASKSVAELARLGYVEDIPSEDARVRTLRLSARGRAAVRAARACRRETETELAAAVGAAELELTRRVLLQALEQLGGSAAIRSRRVRPER
jgi:DNA-binding MarR family transcriptional regulator